MIAMIFAAGKGQRLGVLSKYYQKCTLPVRGKPVLIHWLDALESQLINIKPCVVVDYLSRQVIDIVNIWSSAEAHNARIEIIQREARDKVWEDFTSYLRCEWNIRGRKREPVIFCLADNYSISLGEIISDMLKHNDKPYSTIGLIPTYECSKKTEDAIIGARLENGLYKMIEYQTNIVDEGVWSAGTPGVETALSCAGIGIFTPDSIELTKHCKTLPEALALLSTAGMLYGFKIIQDYIDIGTPEHYSLVCR